MGAERYKFLTHPPWICMSKGSVLCDHISVDISLLDKVFKPYENVFNDL
jgi:hypothetical protein